MKCSKCGGRTFLDRAFSENMNYESSCLLCGDRQYIGKDTELGKWLTKKEKARQHASVLPS